MFQHNAVLIGISGVSSSGKTTLARLLRDIFPNTFVLHEDDFYKTDAEIPTNPSADNVKDWDCLESLNLPALEDALNYIKTHGLPPTDLVSKEDKNDVGPCEVDKKVVNRLEWQASRWMFQDVPPIAIIDGFLLYAEGMKKVRDLFDVKILLRTDFATGKARRENRQGYVTIEGYWEDPPNYWEKVVWPNYVSDHAFLFKDGNVEGELDKTVADKLEIQAVPSAKKDDMTACLEWAYDVIETALQPPKKSQ